nr:MAG TPA: hypothetical protein [Caudoviricetes sp.]
MKKSTLLFICTSGLLCIMAFTVFPEPLKIPSLCVAVVSSIAALATALKR